MQTIMLWRIAVRSVQHGTLGQTYESAPTGGYHMSLPLQVVIINLMAQAVGFVQAQHVSGGRVRLLKKYFMHP